jgi:hypothetical protein
VSHVHSRTPYNKRYDSRVEGERQVKKKIIAMVLLGFIMVGSLVQFISKPVQADHPIVLEYDEPDPGKKIGG